MNIVTSVYDKLDLFDKPHQILTLLTSENVQEADTNLQADIQNAFKKLDESSSDTQLQWTEDLLEAVAYYDEHPLVFRVYRGEDFSIRIDLEEGRDFSGFNLTIRKADDKTLLSPNDTQGQPYSVEPVQQAYIVDLSLSEGQLVKVFVLLENTDGNDLANGNVATLLTTAYLLVEGSLE